MNQIIDSNGILVCNNIPVNINRFEITEIFSKYGPLQGEGIYFGKKNTNVFFIKFVKFRDAIKAYESLKDNKECEHDFKITLSKNDSIKYKAIKGNKQAIEHLKSIYKNIDETTFNNDMITNLFNETNEKNNELLKKRKREKEIGKKKEKSFILNLLTNVDDEPKENEQDSKLKEELKTYLNLNCLCLYNYDENNKFDNYLIPTFPS
ncbi:RNA-binding protein, putative [Hepatocystis sp. ex Piliocolobus tephrosceles]|nr:RNA-binding protein, putative [Hepatocystis sp. ex Piliocolobus tephrosceles]